MRVYDFSADGRFTKPLASTDVFVSGQDGKVRCLDAVEWPLARGMVALMSGVIYCPKATVKAEELSACLVVDDPRALRDLHLAAAKDALDARAPDGTGFRDLALELLEFSKATIGGPDCRWATAADLDAVAERIAE